jgi:hypothetical protein
MPIVGMNYYNSFLALWITGPEGEALAELTNELFAVFNDALEAIYGAAGVPVADVERTYKSNNWNGNRYPTNVRFICRYTLMCQRAGPQRLRPGHSRAPQTDIYPSNGGYERIMKAFLRAMKGAGIL